MAVQTGLATSHYDLLEKFVTFVTTNAELVSLGQNWQLLKTETTAFRAIDNGQTQPSFTSNFVFKYLRAPGLANQDSIYINILCHEASTAQIFNWMILGATGYDPTKTFENQPGTLKTSQASAYPATSLFTLINSQIQYWFVANGRRAIVVAKIGGDFFVAYMGLILPYGKPSEYPYPLLIGANGDTLTIGFTSAYLYNFWNNIYQDSRSMLSINTGFAAQLGPAASVTDAGQVYAAVWPYSAVRSLGEAGNIQGNLDGSFTLLPMIFYSRQNGFVAEYGEAHGLYYVPGSGATSLTSEDTITIGSDTYLVIQNVDKVSRNDYAALLLK